MAAGFSAAAFKASLVAAPVLGKAQAVKGTAVILQNDRRGGGSRLLLGVEQMSGKAADAIPARIRVTARGPITVSAGTRIDFAAYLLPPPQPSRPGGYDFARDAWFAGIGAVGSLQSQTSAKDQGGIGWRWRVLAAIDRARNDVTERIASAIGGQAGEVAAALITGKRGGITEETNDILRAAGIYHVVSISGLHMVLAAGMVFFLVRALFALSPAALLALPVKSIAAVAAIVAAVAYDIFAGSEIATERSLVMTLIVFGAVLAHRRAISMRNLALAAILLVVLEPETVVGPSFQMSFCAVMGLVALYERSGIASAAQEGAALRTLEVPTAKEAPPQDWIGRVLGWMAKHAKALILTTLIAELTTGPFGLYHFQQIQPLGLLGNALVLPLISAIVMPAALMGMIALPFGLDAPVWWAMGWGVEAMLVMAGWVAAIPYAVIAVPAPAGWAVLLAVCGVIWVALWHSVIRYAGVPLIALGFALAWTGPRADLYAAPDGKAAALRGPDGRLALVGPSPGRFGLEQWLRADGDSRKPDDPSLKAEARCDRAGCIFYDSTGSPISFIKQASAFAEDCARTRLIITPLRAPRDCAATVLDAERFSKTGAITGYRTADGGWRFEGVRSPSTDRYWRRSSTRDNERN